MTLTTSATRHEVERITLDLNIQGARIETAHGKTVVHVRGDRDFTDLVVELNHEGHSFNAGGPRETIGPRSYGTASAHIRKY